MSETTTWNIGSQSTIGRYTLLGKIGSGGMAEVFLARSKGAGGIDKVLVLKRIHPVLAQNQRFIEMFMEEARVAMRLNHSNIVQVYAFEQVGSDYVLAMEYVDGSDLLRIQTLAYHQGRRIPFELCAYIALETAKGLDYVHSKKDDYGAPMELVHRDVSPQNILISREGAVKVTDFGIVKAKQVDEELGEVKGKLGYMSPQQARGLPVDRRADVYSLGVVLHEMLVGATKERPKMGEWVELDPPVAVDPTVPQALSDITMKALAPDPRDRYQTAREMAHDLADFLKQQPGLWDAAALEEWIEATIPPDKLSPLVGIDTQADTATEEQTVQISDIGAFEQAVAVVVSVQLIVPEQAAFVEREFDRLMDEIAYKSGAIARIGKEHKRIYLGLPQGRFEDPIAGIRLAYDLLDVVHGLSVDNRIDIDCRVAVVRGPVQVGKVQENGLFPFEPLPKTDGAIAAVLAQCPSGKVLVDHHVFRMARTDYHFGAAQALDVHTESADGSSLWAYPVLGFKNRGDRSSLESRREFGAVGREAELERLRTWFARAQQGMPVLVRLTGELGLGKSQLLHTFAAEAQAEGALVYRAECLFSEQDTPLSGAVAVLRALLSLDEVFDPDQLRGQMSVWLGGAPTYLDRQVESLTRVLVAPDLTWERAGARRRELVRSTAFAIGVLLTVIARTHPVLLLVDNAQWLDGPSVDVLSEVDRHLVDVSVMAVFAGQPETLQGRQIRHMEHLELPELSDDAMRRLVAQRIGTGKEMADITEQILQRAHGNPFFANEIIDSLVEQRIISQRGVDADGAPVYVQTRPGVIHLPATVKGLAESRINALPQHLRTCLRTAAIFGTEFSKEDLLSLMRAESDVDIDELVRRGLLVVADGDQGVPVYRFRRRVDREAAYDGLSRADRQRLHRRLAKRLISARDDGQPVPAVRIAWHLDQSGQDELAARYYLDAARAAMDVYSNRRALRLLDRALSLLPSDSRDRFVALAIKERVVRDLGLHGDHMPLLEEMRELARIHGDADMEAETAYRSGRYMYYEGRFAEAADFLREALETAVTAQNRGIQIESLRALGYLCVELGRCDDALQCCQRALTLVSDDPADSYFRARIQGLRGLALMESERLNEAASAMAYAKVAFSLMGDRRNESVQLANLGLLSAYRGFLVEALGFFEHSLAIDQEIRDVSERGHKLATLAFVRLQLGHFETGNAILEDALRICQENFEPLGEVDARLVAAYRSMAFGDVRRAVDDLLALESIPVVHHSALTWLRWKRLLTEALLAAESYGDAEKHARALWERAQDAHLVHYGVHAQALLACASAFEDRPTEAVELVRQVLRALDRMEGCRDADRLYWYLWRAADAAGDAETREETRMRCRAEVHRRLENIPNPKHRQLYVDHPFVARIMAS